MSSEESTLEKKQKLKGISVKKRIEQLELLTDPVRAQLHQTILNAKEEGIDAESLQKSVMKSRSTLSFHLSKMVKAGLIDVEIPKSGRLIKMYKGKYPLVKVNVEEEKIVERQDSDAILDIFQGHNLEFLEFATSADISLKSLFTQEISQIECEEHSEINFLTFHTNNARIIVPKTTKGFLTEEQLLFVTVKVNEILKEARTRFPDNKELTKVNYKFSFSAHPDFKELV
jgi:DNA-binding transcriptional ArsR family regulator